MVRAAHNLIQNAVDRIDQKAGQPSDETLRIAYGKIKEVNQDTGNITVTLISNLGGTANITTIGPLPLITPMSICNLLYGSLRPGLSVRVFYKGKEQIKNGIAEIIGDDDLAFRLKEVTENKVATANHKLFSGGLGG